MSRARRPLVAAAATAAILGAGVTAATTLSASALETGYYSAIHGDTPTAQSIVKDGAYTVGTATVARANGFGGGTIYYPTNGQSGERFAGVVTMPGFMEPGSALKLYGTRLASHGFVVLVADPLTVFDQPTMRAGEVAAASQALTANQQVANVLEANRIAIVGHSMGGGGVLEAGVRGNYAAIVALHPWDQSPAQMSGVTEPTLVVAGGFDNIAPAGQHAQPMYQAVASQDKAYLLKGAGTHFAALADDPDITGRVLSFLKVYVDQDGRYRTLYCGPSTASAQFTAPSCGR